MKRFLLFLACLSQISVMAQIPDNKGNREYVLIEGFTGVNCNYCPGCAAGLEQMLEEELPVAVIEYHTNSFSTPEYYTDETIARSSFYNVSAYPTTFFDGVVSYVGGGLYPANIYSTLMLYYEQRINVSAPFNVDLIIHHLNGSEYNAEVVVTPNGTCVANDLRVMLAYTQSNIEQEWGNGMTHLECVCRDLIPDENGIVYSGGKQVISENFDIRNYPAGDINVIAWIQDFDSKEVYQAVSVPVNITYNEYDLKLQKVDNVVKSSCAGRISPEVIVKNIGTEAISSFDIVAKMNETEVFRYTWAGEPIAFYDDVSFQLPAFDISIDEVMNLEIRVESPDGYDDDHPEDNFEILNIDPAPICNDYITLSFKTDDHPEETSIDIVNVSTGDTLENITYSQPNHLYSNRIYLDYISCYRLTVHDAAGDGISSYFSVRDKNNGLVFNGAPAVNPFNQWISFEFHANEGIPVLLDEKCDNKNVFLYPNPAKDYVFVFGSDVCGVKVYNLYGKLLFETTDAMVPVNAFDYGIYFFEILRNSERPLLKKVVVGM
jgi:hypothetical protein